MGVCSVEANDQEVLDLLERISSSLTDILDEIRSAQWSLAMRALPEEPLPQAPVNTTKDACVEGNITRDYPAGENITEDKYWSSLLV